MNDGLKIEGFVEIELVNKKDKVRRVYKNTITNSGKKFLLDKSAGRILKLGADCGGDMVAQSNIDIRVYSDSGYYPGRTSHKDYCLTNVLLNLGSEATGLTGASGFIPIYDSNLLVDNSKVIGYANSEASQITGNTKSGITDSCKGEYIIDGTCVARRWKYAEGIASGTIDTIAMMPRDVIENIRGKGISIAKCIDICNLQDGGVLSTGFCPPGVTGYTGNNEVLLNTNAGRKKFNLTTGETTDVASTDPFWVFPSSLGRMFDYIELFNKLYVLYNSDSDVYDGTLSMAVFDLSNNMNQVWAGGVIYDSWGDYHYSAGKFLYFDNDNVYITVISNGSSSSVKGVKLSWDGGVGRYTPGTTYTNWSFLSTFNMPGAFLASNGIVGNDGNCFCLGNYGSDYAMYVLDSNIAGMKMIRFTDLSDVEGSIVDVASGLPLDVCAFNNANAAGFLRIGSWLGQSSDGVSKDNLDAILSLTNVTGSNTRRTYDETNAGTFLTLDGWWCNALSFVKLETPIQKGDSDVMYVSYGYRVV